MSDAIDRLYEKFFASRGLERTGLFELLKKEFGIQRALYPGSYVHVSPSFVIPSVTYVDSDRKAQRFFKTGMAEAIVAANKRYTQPAVVRFLAADYSSDLGLADASFDLLISQYAGPVSQACRSYLRLGGTLVANDSHGDATLAFLDPGYEFVAVASGQGERFQLSEDDLGSYFTPRSGKPLEREEVLEAGRGPVYSKPATDYVFKRVA